MPILTQKAHLLRRLNLIVKGKDPGEPRYVELQKRDMARKTANARKRKLKAA